MTLDVKISRYTSMFSGQDPDPLIHICSPGMPPSPPAGRGSRWFPDYGCTAHQKKGKRMGSQCIEHSAADPGWY